MFWIVGYWYNKQNFSSYWVSTVSCCVAESNILTLFLHLQYDSFGYHVLLAVGAIIRVAAQCTLLHNFVLLVFMPKSCQNSFCIKFYIDGFFIIILSYQESGLFPSLSLSPVTLFSFSLLHFPMTSSLYHQRFLPKCRKQYTDRTLNSHLFFLSSF